MGSRRPFAKSLAQNKRSEEHQEEQSQTVGDEDESLVWKQIPYPQQNEGEKAPRENERPENAVSGHRDRACNEDEREKDCGQKPERTKLSQRIKKNRYRAGERSAGWSARYRLSTAGPDRIRCVSFLLFRSSSGSRVESLFLAGTCPVPPKRNMRGRGAQYERNFLSGKPRRACPVLTGWAGSFTLPIFQGSFLLTPGFFPESKEKCAPPPRGF